MNRHKHQSPTSYEEATFQVPDHVAQEQQVQQQRKGVRNALAADWLPHILQTALSTRGKELGDYTGEERQIVVRACSHLALDAAETFMEIAEGR